MCADYTGSNLNLKGSKIKNSTGLMGPENVGLWMPWFQHSGCTDCLCQNGTVAGKFSVEPPTLTALGFDWWIDGDDNRNARVEVSYRQKGETRWRAALPLMRLQHERIGDPVGPGYPKPPVSDGTGYVSPFI
jgi:hypothetical protein